MPGFPEFFTILSVLPAFDIDEAMLEAGYFREQRRFHPDRFVREPQEERLAAAERSADINRAYQTLKDPLKRAQYLLLLQGIFVGTERDSVKPDKQLLMEIMELRETIADTKSMRELYVLGDELRDTEQQLLRKISDSYNKSRWDDMAQYTIKLSYIMKAQGDIMRKMWPQKQDKR